MNTDPYWGAEAVIALVFPAVGAVIVSRYPVNALGWIFCALGVSAAASGFVSQYATHALLSDPGSQLGIEAVWFSSLLGNLSFVSLVFVPLLFPNGRPPSRRWRPVLWLIAVVITLTVVSFAFTPGPLAEYPSAKNPFGIEGLQPVFDFLSVAAGPVGIFCMLASVTSLVVRFWHSRGDEREQLKWFTYAIVLGLSSLVLNGIFPDLAWLIGGLGTAALPVAIGIAVVKYRLYDIDVIINRTLVYAALTVSLVLVYFGGVVALQYVFRAFTGDKSQLAIVASTLAIAALFSPLRRRVQDLVDRRFYRRKYDAARTLEAFGARLRDETDLESLSGYLVDVVRETMQPSHVSLWLRSPAEQESKGVGEGA
ncbi:MAG TPA: hypothetical protein VFJ72_11150 [Rubrobacteraceae bacterium]|nr:hypothetical protein [Rubrobacteraceae bacterium]